MPYRRPVGVGEEISILAVLADRDQEAVADKYTAMISILAVLADRDTCNRFKKGWSAWISILAVLADRDKLDAMENYARTQFQSSRSLRTATETQYAAVHQADDFNPRGPCGPRLSSARISMR